MAWQSLRPLACFVSVALVSAVSVPSPNRYYTFDTDGDYTNVGQDAGGDLWFNGSATFITHKSAECKTGLGGCVQVDTKPLSSDDDPMEEALSSPIDLSSYSALTVCYWIKHIGLLSDWSVSLAIQPGGPPARLYDPSVWSAHNHPSGQTTSHHLYDAFMTTDGHDSISEWLHTCILVDDGAYRVYHNGLLTASAGGAGFEDPSDMGSSMFYLGSSMESTYLQGSALLDDIRIYDQLLTPGEIFAVMQTTDASRTSTDPNVCTAEQMAACSANARCDRAGNESTCSCLDGFSGDGVACSDVDECAMAISCDALAYCANFEGGVRCQCPEGFRGDGRDCSSESWAVRSVCTFADVASVDTGLLRRQYARAVSGSYFDPQPAAYPILAATQTRIDETGDQITIQAFFDTNEAASSALAAMNPSLDWTQLQNCTLTDGPDIYTWVGRSTKDPIQVSPSGMDLNFVYFEPSCLESGCWVVDVTYTTGSDDFNAFYLPKAVGSDALSYDFDYSSPDAKWTFQSPADTFLPNTHPCTGADYRAEDGLTAQVSSCCLDQFLDMYRPIASFATAVNGSTGSNCGVGPRDRALTQADVHTFDFFELGGDAAAPPGVYVDGPFAGMISYGTTRGVVDPYIGIYKARFFLDEIELRRLAGQLRGTVGVEHTVDTFLGLLNLSPTGMYVLDTMASQVAIHLEKTSFFSVSTHGTNDYTFLEYVNMRLIAIYLEDADFSGEAEAEDRSVRTDSVAAAHYVQVTFTLGSQYGVNGNEGLVPLSSVRAGKGTFFDSAPMYHKCLEWTGAPNSAGGNYSFSDQTTFTSRLGQDCAPAAPMCSSPSTIPDSFVSFNIPLGVDFFDPPSQGLDNNVFVDMAISAVDEVAQSSGEDPNDGESPWQSKTTLTGSIPVVEGGVNIFCDGITAKTDLKDVANADIVVGSASTADELSRLRITKDIASTQLDPEAVTAIDSDSIESALMTLVLKGNASYFQSNGGRAQVTIELEDVITIHIMEDDGSGGDTTVASSVSSLLAAPADDNSDTSGLLTEGYFLNGAFYFTIDRSAQRAHLEPSTALLELCPWNPPRPVPGAMPLETCITRRDVRYRQFPWRAGAKSTAMEICVAGVCPSGPSATASSESAFFVTMFGDNEYARRLAVDYSTLISAEYGLNGRYRRAFWINPGYEWTPAQTGGSAIFSVSQKLFLFALITLDEGVAVDAGNTLPEPGPNLRRRALLQASPDEALKDGQSGLGGEVFEFETSPTQLMAKSFNVPEDLVATFSVQLQLTQAEACMTKNELQAALRSTLEDYLALSASSLHTVQVTGLNVHGADVQCDRRAVRSLLAAFSDATAEAKMLLVFKDHGQAVVSLAKLQTMAGVVSVEPISVSASINTAAETTWVPPPERHVDESGESGKLNMVLIGAAAGGGAAAILLVAGAFRLMRSRHREREDVESAVHTISVEDLKVQLANDV